MKRESEKYMLGTHKEELHRLGIQHQVWSSEARRGWEIAEFGNGQTILDLGSGPGFCAMELAYMVGEEGKIIAVDKSDAFIEYLNFRAKTDELNIETMCCDFRDLKLPDNSLDGIFSRWALAWIDEVDDVVEDLSKALRPGGAMVFQEYYDWRTLQCHPANKSFDTAKEAVLAAFATSGGNINIGKELGVIMSDNNIEVVSMRAIPQMCVPGQLNWEWPKSFFKIFLPELANAGLMTKDESDAANAYLEELEGIGGSSILGPLAIELVGIKMD